MGLATALCEADFAEGSAAGEFFDPFADFAFFDVLRVKRTTIPAHKVAMVLVLRIGNGVEEQVEAGNAADVFWRGGALAIDVAGIFDSGIGVGDRLDCDRVPPIVTEVVGVGQFRDAPRIASRPRLTARWVLPVPGGPKNKTVSPWAIQRQVAGLSGISCVRP